MTYVLVADKKDYNLMLVSRGSGLYRQVAKKTSLKIKPDEWNIHTVAIFNTKSSVKCM